ncbi:hypothetical protein PF003_g10619 [Phytophthora fragariae]|nr:hypothetical protein PF003_g10619 [Phytophthora fragariae]
MPLFPAVERCAVAPAGLGKGRGHASSDCSVDRLQAVSVLVKHLVRERVALLK